MTTSRAPLDAGWFRTPQGPLFGCYHPPAPDRARNVAVLMCDPFGSDRMNLHLTYRALAERLADAGFPVLRFDYPGTCDSGGYPRASVRISIWQAAIRSAADQLIALSGCEQLTLFGALLGGTLALTVAPDRPDIVGTVLWGPFPTGRQVLREIRAFSAMTSANPRGLKPRDWQDEDREAIGFLVPAEMGAELAALSIPDLGSSSLRVAAVFRRNSAFPVEPVVDSLESAGVEVTVQTEAAVDMAELVAEKALPPQSLLEDMVRWWDRSFPRNSSSKTAELKRLAKLQSSIEVLSRDGQTVEESVARFGKDHGIFGILTRPLAVAGRSKTAIVLVNGGSNHRVGINRNYTEWARRWAAVGCTVLRFDIRGLGDSPPRHSKELGILYREETRDDVVAAIDFLTRDATYDRCVCLGLCAGGYQSFHAALVDPRITGVVMLNPLRFRPATAAKPHDVDLQYASVSHYVRAWRDPKRWRRMLRGDVDVLGIVGSIARRWMRSTWARARGLWGRPQRGTTWLAARLFELTDRGCFVRIFFDSSDPMCHRAAEELTDDRLQLEATGRFSFETIDNSDHIFSPLWSQERLTDRLNAMVRSWSSPEAPPMDQPQQDSGNGRHDDNLVSQRQ